MSDTVAEKMYVNSALQMHAHKCEACAKNGKDVKWIHPNICRGKVAAHRCPECGSVQWKQCQIESGKLPQVATVQPGINLDAIIGYVLLVVAVAIVAYCGYLYVKKMQHGDLIINEGDEGVK